MPDQHILGGLVIQVYGIWLRA